MIMRLVHNSFHQDNTTKGKRNEIQNKQNDFNGSF
jgi:hypothetical protein